MSNIPTIVSAKLNEAAVDISRGYGLREAAEHLENAGQPLEAWRLRSKARRAEDAARIAVIEACRSLGISVDAAASRELAQAGGRSMAKVHDVPGIGRVKPKKGYEFKVDGSVGLKAGWEIFDGKPTKVLNGDRSGWWRLHDHYDRNGYCDNPGRGY